MGCTCGASIDPTSVHPVSQYAAKNPNDPQICAGKCVDPQRQGRPCLPALARAAAVAASDSSACEKVADHVNFIACRSGDILDVYDFGSSVGKGAYGTVCKAKHRKQGNICAVKFISQEKRSSRVLRRFLREVYLLKQMDHPGIVRVFETFHGQGNVYLVMELCTGGELLRKLTARVMFTEKDAAITMQQIFRAVNYMHNIGVVHRDLKPENWDFENVVNIPDVLRACPRVPMVSSRGHCELKEVLPTSQYHTDERLCQRVFDIFDLDNRGYITQADVQRVLSGASAAKALTEEKSSVDLFALVDSDGDDRIDFGEFMQMMRHGTPHEDEHVLF